MDLAAEASAAPVWLSYFSPAMAILALIVSIAATGDPAPS
jgi:hypothetical protein